MLDDGVQQHLHHWDHRADRGIAPRRGVAAVATHQLPGRGKIVGCFRLPSARRWQIDPRRTTSATSVKTGRIRSAPDLSNSSMVLCSDNGDPHEAREPAADLVGE